MPRYVGQPRDVQEIVVHSEAVGELDEATGLGGVRR